MNFSGSICGLSTLLVLSIQVHALGVDACPIPMAITQPDGTAITLQLRGNEAYSWYEDSDGYTVVSNENGNYVYAVPTDDGRLAPSNQPVGKFGVIRGRSALQLRRHLLPARRILSQRRVTPDELADDLEPTLERVAATTGGDGDGESATAKLRNLVLLLRFKNHANRALPSREVIEKIFNAVNGDPQVAPTGSVRDVYLKNSAGALELVSAVSPWLDLPEEERFYAAGTSGATHSRMQQAIVHGLERLKETTPDFPFTDFDQNNDGKIDAIAFIHSGYGAEFGGTDSDGASKDDRIWSHKWQINPWTWKGVEVQHYHISAGLWGREGSEPCRIGVICHETGHFLGLPDLYDTGDVGQGIGSWGLMGNSWGFDGTQYHPPHMSAWSKSILGWATVLPLPDDGVVSLPIVEKVPYSSPDDELARTRVFKITAPTDSKQYFLLEARDHRVLGNDDAPLPGLLVWHVDENKSANEEAAWPGDPASDWPTRHYKVAVVQGDASFELSRSLRNPGDSGDMFRTHHAPKLQFYPPVVAATPTITDIKIGTDNISFRVAPGP